MKFDLQRLDYLLEETIRYANRARQTLSVLNQVGADLPDNLKQFELNEVYRAVRDAYENCKPALNLSKTRAVDPDDDWTMTMKSGE